MVKYPFFFILEVVLLPKLAIVYCKDGVGYCYVLRDYKYIVTILDNQCIKKHDIKTWLYLEKQ